MLIGQKEFRKILVQESIEVYFERGMLNEAYVMYQDNREVIEEGWLNDLIAKHAPGVRVNWKTIAQDAEVEDVAEKILKTGMGKRYDTESAERLARKYIEGTDADISPEELEMISTITSEISKDPALAKQAVAAAEKEDVGTGGGDDEETKKKPETVATTVKDLASVLRDPSQRVLLMKGLYRLMINKSVLGVLNALPGGQGDAVRNLLVQMMEMDPKVLAAVRTKVGDEFDVEDQAKGQNVPAAWRKQGMDAQRKGLVQGAEKEAGLGLKESKNSRAMTERAIILEILGLYIERKANKII
jgi:hypothetical protein